MTMSYFSLESKIFFLFIFFSDREKAVLVVGILVAVCLFAVLVGGGIFYYRKKQRKYPQKR